MSVPSEPRFGTTNDEEMVVSSAEVLPRNAPTERPDSRPVILAAPPETLSTESSP